MKRLLLLPTHLNHSGPKREEKKGISKITEINENKLFSLPLNSPLSLFVYTRNSLLISWSRYYRLDLRNRPKPFYKVG